MDTEIWEGTIKNGVASAMIQVHPLVSSNSSLRGYVMDFPSTSSLSSIESVGGEQTDKNGL